MVLLGEGGQSIFNTRRLIAPTGYRSQESGQTEIKGSANLGTGSSTLATVTTGRTAYIYDLIFSGNNTNDTLYNVGGFEILYYQTGSEPLHIRLSVPLVFTSGTAITGSVSDATNNNFVTIIGFEE